MSKALFVVFEGIDGCGKSSQIARLMEEIRRKDKYQAILTTREPTWRAGRIREMLAWDGNAFSNAEKLAKLFVEDRKEHVKYEILPMLEQRVAVLSDRYSMSTLAYQAAQGVSMNYLIRLHGGGIIEPNVTFYVDVPLEVALERMRKRGAVAEKFEGDPDFIKLLIGEYKHIAERSKRDKELKRVVGRVEIIDGRSSEEKVADKIKKRFMSVCDYWLEGRK